jgi:tetraacyldisaccharide 4'-kinase
LRLEPPSWWYRDDATLLARLLTPAAGLVAAAARRRFDQTKPYRSRLPVLCVGNLTVGGAGKTPVALAIGGMLKAARRRPGFLTRGYGGDKREPHLVALDHDTATDVGDEALLLARIAPTVVARDRAAGAKVLEARGLDVIVMDDGLQNPTLAKTLSLAVLDPQRLIGNGLVMPAGPLRAGLADQLRRTDALVVLCGAGEQMPDLPPALRSFTGPVLRAELSPDKPVAASVRGQRVVAFAGIGRPSKLFDTLRALGADVVSETPFPDHHRFSVAEADRLLQLSDSHRAMLVTTEKDLARLPSTGRLADLKNASVALPVSAQFAGRDFDRLVSMLELFLSR